MPRYNEGTSNAQSSLSEMLRESEVNTRELYEWQSRTLQRAYENAANRTPRVWGSAAWRGVVGSGGEDDIVESEMRSAPLTAEAIENARILLETLCDDRGERTQ